MSLPGHLNIGTTYTNSRIRCNAGVGGYTGYAELMAASNYGMFLNLQTTRTDGGWMYFKMNNDDYAQLSGSDNKVNMYKDTTISGNLDVSKVLTLQRNPAVSDTPPQISIKSISNGWFLGQFESTVNNIGCLIEYKTIASSTSWWTGVWGSNTNEFNLWFNYKGLSLKTTGDAVISGNLDIGPSQAQSRIRTLFNHVGSTGYMMMEGRYRDQGFLHFETNHQYGEIFLIVRNTYFTRCSDYVCW